MSFTKSIAQQNYTNELGLSAVSQPNLTPSSVISPVVDIRQRFSIIGRTASSTGGNATVYTTDNRGDQDFYLSSVALSFAKSAASDNVLTYVEVIVGGSTYSVLAIVSITLTASERSMVLSLPYPLKLDKNSTIKLIGAFTAGSITKWAAITGFYA